MLRLLGSALILPLPWPVRRFFYRVLFDCKIDPSAYIGFSLIAVKALEMSEGSRIGHLNVIKGPDLICLKEAARIGNLNWISAFPSDTGSGHFSHVPERSPRLHLGAHSAITNRHLIDCTDAISLGAFSTFAGFRSQILTHSIDLEGGRQSCRPVLIGRYCFVGTASTLLGGSRLPDFSVLAAGGVLATAETEMYSLYGGVPAKLKRQLPAGWKYFTRPTGFVV